MRLSFKTKLLIFALAVMLVPTAVLVSLFISNFNSSTDFSLAQNTEGITQSNREFLLNLANDQARLTSLQFQNAIDGVTVLGRAAQQLIDHYGQLAALEQIYATDLFRDELIRFEGAITNPPSDSVNVLVPPPIADSPRSLELLRVSSLLNLIIGPVYESDMNNTLVYFVGDRANPITRAYPNKNLAGLLDEFGALSALFWQQFFAENVAPWERYYQDAEFRAQVDAVVGSPVTVDPPYEDAAGAGKVITLFYPLWDGLDDEFGGVVAADVSLASIVENVLAVKLAQTGYAVLMNGAGEVIAMPERGERELRMQTREIERNGLQYYLQTLSSSEDSGVQSVATQILAEDEGYLEVTFDDGEAHVMVYATIDPINDASYGADRWKILLTVPEREILSTLFETHSAIQERHAAAIVLLLSVVAAIVVVVIIVTVLIAGRITRDLGRLTGAASEISQKRYELDLDVSGADEFGELAQAFVQMSAEIKGYTTHLEDMVAERTDELQKALGQIQELNDRLQDENVRLSAELDVAKRLQLMVLPRGKELREIRDLDIACSMDPADEVGGDYYDFIRADGSVLFGIGDVTGHGLAAGVIMLMAQTAIQTVSLTGEQDMTRFLELVNRVLFNNIARITEDKSMTLALIKYRDGTYTVVGQHESLIVCRADGRIEITDTIDMGLFLGFEPEIGEFIREAKLELAAGDTLVLYTDGVTEAVNPEGAEFGLRRLTDQVAANHHRDAAAILESVKQRLHQFIGTATVHDDISLVVIKQR